MKDDLKNTQSQGNADSTDNSAISQGNKSKFSKTASVNRNLRSATAQNQAQNAGFMPPPPQGFGPNAMPLPPNMGGIFPPQGAMGNFPPNMPPYGAPMPQQFPQTGIEYDENGNPVFVEYVYEDENADDDEEFVEDEVLDESAASSGQIPPNVGAFAPPPLGANFPPQGAGNFPPPIMPPPFIPNAPQAMPPFGMPPFGAQNEEPHPNMGKDISIDNKTILNLQKDGFEKAQQQEIEDVSQQRYKYFVNFLLFIAVLSGLTFGVYKFYEVFKPQRSLAEFETEVADVSSTWSLPDTKANNIVKEFYQNSGGINNAGRVQNKTIWGSLHAGINVESFYCIERNSRAYLRFNNPVYPKVYLLNSEGDAKKLETTSVTGPSEIVSAFISSQLNAIVFFDEVLHKAAFENYAVNKEPFTYAGSMAVGDNVCDVIEIYPVKNMKLSFLFDRKTKRIVQKLIDFNGIKTRVEYSDYAEFANRIFYPKTRTIYVNENLFGSVVTDTMHFNKDIVFPR